jgi:uncharacterized SAM-binding protein YcdF (DUF218 family)
VLLKILAPKQSPLFSRSRSAKRRKRRGLLLLLPILAASGWIGYKQLQSYFIQPQAIFVLGGHENRERFAAKLAAQHPHIPIWVSSGSPRSYVQKIFAKAGIQRDRLHLDYRARDTVTNFTTLVDELKAHGIESVYLITSDNHMRRARLVGEIVFGSQGIIIKPMAVPSQAPPEPLEKCLRDGTRALLWLVTGDTGETFIQGKR